MLAWAQSGHPNAGKRATWWLKKLWNDSELESDSKLLPSVRTYNAVLKALAAAEGAMAAESLLLDLGDKFREERLAYLRPNSESFSIVIRAWLQQAHSDDDIHEKTKSLSRAVEWLSSLREVEDETRLSTAPELYTGVMRAALSCARARPDVLELATRAFNDLRNSRYEVDCFSYSLMVQVALAALSGPDDGDVRDSFLQRVFEDCCEDGLISNAFIKAIAQSRVHASGWTVEERERLMKSFFGNWPLPASWTRNVSNETFLPIAFVESMK